MTQGLKLEAENLVRVHVDIPFDIAQKIKVRIATLSLTKGSHYSRRDYLTDLVVADIEKNFKGAAVRVVSKMKAKI